MYTSDYKIKWMQIYCLTRFKIWCFKLAKVMGMYQQDMQHVNMQPMGFQQPRPMDHTYAQNYAQQHMVRLFLWTFLKHL